MWFAAAHWARQQQAAGEREAPKSAPTVWPSNAKSYVTDKEKARSPGGLTYWTVREFELSKRVWEAIREENNPDLLYPPVWYIEHRAWQALESVGFIEFLENRGVRISA